MGDRRVIKHPNGGYAVQRRILPYVGERFIWVFERDVVDGMKVITYPTKAEATASLSALNGEGE